MACNVDYIDKSRSKTSKQLKKLVQSTSNMKLPKRFEKIYMEQI